MGILSGSSTYLRFRVEGGVSSNYAEVFEKALEIRRFVPLHPDGEDNESSGWVLFQRPYADEETILSDSFLFGDSIMLGFREDSMAYPKAMMKDWVKKRLTDYQEKNHAKITPSIKKAIEATVKSEIRKRILPKSKVVNCQWDLSRSRVRFFSRGKGLVERFVELFEQTFQVKLHLQTFAGLAETANLSLMEKSLLETLKPQEIFKIAIRTEVN